MQIPIVLGLLVVALILFATEVTSVDIITMLLLITLVVTGILTPSESFAGFSNEIIVILASIFVLSGALQKTGVVDTIGSYIHRIAGSSHRRLSLTVMAMVGGVSAFMNNTTATAVFLPPVMGLSRKTKISPSKLLMPMAFASSGWETCCCFMGNPSGCKTFGETPTLQFSKSSLPRGRASREASTLRYSSLLRFFSAALDGFRCRYHSSRLLC